MFTLAMSKESAQMLRKMITYKPENYQIPDRRSKRPKQGRAPDRVDLCDLAERDARGRGGEDGGEKHARDEATEEFHLLCRGEEADENVGFDEDDGNDNTDRDDGEVLEKEPGGVLRFHNKI